MTLRQWYAGMALPQVDARSHGTPDDIAKECFQLADAMIRAGEAADGENAVRRHRG
jgi:hypothetical protein